MTITLSSVASGQEVGSAPPAVRSGRLGIAVLGLLPFFVYMALFFVLPTGVIITEAFRHTDVETQVTTFTVKNLTDSLHGAYLTSLVHSIELSLVTSVLSAVLGLMLAWAIVSGTNATVRRLVASAAAVLANFGGLPLAFLFVASIGNAGVLTHGLASTGIHLEDNLLYSLTGVEFVYLYFLIPLMVLVITPALEALKPQWREASDNLGANTWQYWRHVAGPILAPNVAGSIALLFCGAFSAYATAAALTNGTLSITPLSISSALNGNVLVGQENLGDALALDMVVIVVPLTFAYQYMQRKTSRWLQ